jgi:hypothetical protein
MSPVIWSVFIGIVFGILFIWGVVFYILIKEGIGDFF